VNSYLNKKSHDVADQNKHHDLDKIISLIILPLKLNCNYRMLEGGL
jgi:hypothetical protein